MRGHTRKIRFGERQQSEIQEGGTEHKKQSPHIVKPLRFHVLAIPHTVTRKDYSACAFTQNVRMFCKMMHRRGHIVYHYGHTDSEVECTEHISVTDNELFEKTYGHYDWKKELFKHNTSDLCNKTFNQRSIQEISKRKKKHDFLLLFWGIGHEEVGKAHPDMVVVEPAIGCFNRFSAPFSVFASYSLMNYMYGKEKLEPRWYDAVIPHYFDLEDFTFTPKAKEGKEAYFMYIGRIIESKGIGIAVEICNRLGIKLKVAGQGDFKQNVGFDPPECVELVGYLEPHERNELVRHAKALIVATHYNEPFGCVTIEALLNGTPLITTDWGAFTENNLHGITGYRCRTMEQFIWAAKHIDNIDRHACRAWAEKNFSLERIAPMYEEYFSSLTNVFKRDGFYTPNPHRTELDWLSKEYPCSK